MEKMAHMHTPFYSIPYTIPTISTIHVIQLKYLVMETVIPHTLHIFNKNSCTYFCMGVSFWMLKLFLYSFFLFCFIGNIA